MYQELIRISGKVQGVGFRAHVKHCADATGVRGRVWNYPSPDVGIVAEHEDAGVLYNEFLRAVMTLGPGRLDTVCCTRWQGEAFSDFRIVSSAPK